MFAISFKFRRFILFVEIFLFGFPRQAGLHLYFVLDAEQTIVERFITTIVLEDLQDAYYDSGKHQSHYRFLLSDQISMSEIARVLRDLLYKNISASDVTDQTISPEKIKEKYKQIVFLIEDILGKYDALPKPFRSNSCAS